MEKIPKFADGGSFSRRTSSFINAPKFTPTTPDIPDVKGFDLLAKQARPSAGKTKSPTGKLVDFKLPEINGRPGRVEWIQNQFMDNVRAYQEYGKSQGADWFYTPDAQMMGTNIINEMLQWKVKAEEENRISTDAFTKSSDSHDDVFLDPYNTDFRVRAIEERETGELNEDGTPKLEKYLSDKISNVKVWDYYANKDLYGKPLTYAENFTDQHNNVTNSPFGADNQNIPVTSSPASFEDAEAYSRKVLNDAASKGIGDVKYKNLGEIGLSPQAIEKHGDDVFELVREKVKDNFSNLEAAKEILRYAPEKFKSAYIRDWAKKLNNGSYDGEQSAFYESLIGAMGASVRDRTETVTDSKADGSNLGGAAPGFWYQALIGTPIRSDEPDRTESYWVKNPDGKVAKQDMQIYDFPTHPKMEPFNNLNDLQSGFAMATDQYTDDAWVMGTKVDFSTVKGEFKDPNIITGIEYMIDPEGNETLFKEKIIFVDGDKLDPEDFRLFVPKHGVNPDGTPKIEAEKQGVFDWWPRADNITSAFKGKGSVGRIEGDQAQKINQTVGLGNENEVYYIKIKVRMTLQEIMGLEVDGLKSRQEVESRFYQDALYKQQAAKKTKRAMIGAIDEPTTKTDSTGAKPPVPPIVKDPNDL